MKRPRRRLLPISTTRPSCTATTEALGPAVRLTTCISGAGLARAAAAAAAAGETAEPEPGGAFDFGAAAAAAPAVALPGADSVWAPLHSSESPSTGGRPSTRPVRVAMT